MVTSTAISQLRGVTDKLRYFPASDARHVVGNGFRLGGRLLRQRSSGHKLDGNDYRSRLARFIGNDLDTLVRHNYNVLLRSFTANARPAASIPNVPGSGAGVD